MAIPPLETVSEMMIIDPPPPTGLPLECPSFTRTAETAIMSACSRNEMQSTQRFVAPRRRCSAVSSTLPSRKLRMLARDFVQAIRGAETGRSLTPSAAKTVLPVWSFLCGVRELVGPG